VDGFCDVEGAALTQRADDTEEVFKERMRAYGALTAPVVEHYRSLDVLRKWMETGRLQKLRPELLPLWICCADNATERWCCALLAVSQMSATTESEVSAEYLLPNIHRCWKVWFGGRTEVVSGDRKMRRAGQVVREVLELVRERVKPGATRSIWRRQRKEAGRTGC